MATIFGTSSIDNLFGTAGADSLVGLAGNDVLFGGAGSDTFDGGVGSDTANYAGLGTAITLRDQGRVDKGVFGSDRLENMEKIIGAVGFRNVIDGTVSGSQVTNFFVDLGGAVPSLIVNNIPGLGSASFQVVNFVDVIGTANNDTLLGDAQANLLSGAGGDDSLNGRAGNDILQGGTGSDTLNGGDGFDTANYSALGGPITLRERGRVDKGTFGLDSLLGMERIIGAVAFRNVIDGTVDDPQSTSFFVNLGAEQLLISGIPTVGIATFQVTNFVDVIGTSNNDVLIGSAQANLLSGGGGNDALIGGAGNDTLDGGTGNDRMAGDAGNDFFVVDGAGDSVSDSAGTDTILLRTGSINLSGIFVENVTGDIVGQAFSITGNS
ncbi:MAG: hypothetical protein ING16_03765, partial [Roseomonas sp.]|nr:hypothetical protein [Roseomonas sp.]